MSDWLAPWRGRVRVSLFLSDLVSGDAVSGDCLEMEAILRRWGFPADIYVERVDDRLRHQVKPFSQYRPQDRELIIFHYSVWSEMADYLRSLSERRMMMVYHNITPPHYFRGSNPKAEELTHRGRETLADFARVTLLAVGDSEFNRRELEEAGFTTTGVLPILLDLSRLDEEPNQVILRLFDDDWTNLLLVGRVAPQKRHEDVVKVFYYYKRINRRSRLFFVGAQDIAHAYRGWLDGLLQRLDLGQDVHFPGHTSHADLLAYYRLGDVFLCMSEHEGFCVPIVESMYLGVPVIAYASTAVPYTLGDGGILVHRKDYRAIAELVHLLVSDGVLRERVVARGRERAQHFSRQRTEVLLAEFLRQALEALRNEMGWWD